MSRVPVGRGARFSCGSATPMTTTRRPGRQLLISAGRGGKATPTGARADPRARSAATRAATGAAASTAPSAARRPHPRAVVARTSSYSGSIVVRVPDDPDRRRHHRGHPQPRRKAWRRRWCTRRLAACAQISPDRERLPLAGPGAAASPRCRIVIKTTRERYAQVEQAIRELHSYSCRRSTPWHSKRSTRLMASGLRNHAAAEPESHELTLTGIANEHPVPSQPGTRGAQPKRSGSMEERLAFQSRYVLVFGEIDDKLAHATCRRLLALSEQSDAPITMLSVVAGRPCRVGRRDLRA